MQPGWDLFFLPARNGSDGQRLCVYHRPAPAPARGAVVYVHPFGEEMNKSRRMAALQARALAAAGYAVLQIDLKGCGDSSGDFGDASWADWVDDVTAAARWLQERHDAPLWLWGLRAGCLLASEAAQALEGAAHVLLWQPPVSGRGLVQQLLRLKLAGALLEGDAKGQAQALRERIAQGETIEVAGYRLQPALLAGLEASTLAQPAAGAQVRWREVTSREPATLAPVSVPLIERWQAAGVQVDARCVTGPAFWQTAEIETVPSLIEGDLHLAA